MPSKENLIKRLREPAETQRKMLSVVTRDLRAVLDVMMRQDVSKPLAVDDPLQMKIKKLLAEMNMVQRKMEEMLDAMRSLDPGMTAELSSADSLSPKQEKHPVEKHETLFAHRGSVAVSEPQDFAAIRSEVIDRHVREENR